MMPSIPKVEKRLVASLLARGPTGFALAVEGAAPVWAFGPSEFKQSHTEKEHFCSLE
jgi:hypothetical protein